VAFLNWYMPLVLLARMPCMPVLCYLGEFAYQAAQII